MRDEGLGEQRRRTSAAPIECFGAQVNGFSRSLEALPLMYHWVPAWFQGFSRSEGTSATAGKKSGAHEPSGWDRQVCAEECRLTEAQCLPDGLKQRLSDRFLLTVGWLLTAEFPRVS